MPFKFDYSAPAKECVHRLAREGRGVAALAECFFFTILSLRHAKSTKQIPGPTLPLAYLKKLPTEIAISNGSSFEEPALILKENCSRNGVT